MKSIPFTLLFVTAAILGAATFVEDARGTAFVREYVYATWWFKALWMLLAASAAVVLVRRRMWRRPAAFVLHAGLLVVFAGALLTAFTGHKGLLHLRQGEPASSYVDEKKRVAHLPFVLTLDSFRVEYYAGTSAPSDYVSQVACHDADGTLMARPRISMNRIFSAEGYRFYQSSFDEDLKGSWLTVNHDPYGTAVAYTGFLLICIGSLGLLLDPRGGFRRLLRHPLLRKGGLFALLCLLAVDGQAAEPLPVVRRAQADSLAARQVMYNDRVAPLNTLCRDFVQKVYGRSVFRGLSPEQVVASWMLYPEEWNRVPIIRIKNRELRERLGIRGEYATLAGLFDGTTYKLQPLWQQEMGKHSQLGRAIQETDEKAGLALMLTQGTLVRPLPPGTPRLSEQQVRAELLYNRIPFNKILFMANLTLGFVAIGLFLYRMLKRRGENRTSRRLWTAALWLSTLFHAAGYMLRLAHGLPARAALPLRPPLWFPPFRLHAAGGPSGRDEPANHAPDARARLAVAQLARVAHHDFLCPVRLHLPERVAGRGTDGTPPTPARRTGPGTGGTTHAVEPPAALSFHLSFGHRHPARFGVGQRVVGQLLVVGPERSVGPRGLHGLRSRFPPPHPALAAPPAGVPPLHGGGFPRGAHDVFRGQLPARRDAQLRQPLVKSLLSGIVRAGECP